jgi:CrcB protein
MTTALLIGLGAFFGAMARYGIGTWIGGATGHGFPWATFLINVSGSFLLGLLMRVMRGTDSSFDLRAMLSTGLCGGYTTFSTFSYDVIVLMENGHRSTALIYAAASSILSPLACWCGYLLGAVARE